MSQRWLDLAASRLAPAVSTLQGFNDGQMRKRQ
jgi:hypothetical protein